MPSRPQVGCSASFLSAACPLPHQRHVQGCNQTRQGRSSTQVGIAGRRPQVWMIWTTHSSHAPNGGSKFEKQLSCLARDWHMKTTNMNNPLIPKCEMKTAHRHCHVPFPIQFAVVSAPSHAHSRRLARTERAPDARSCKYAPHLLSCCNQHSIRGSANLTLAREPELSRRAERAARKRSGSFTVDGERAALKNKNCLNRVGEKQSSAPRLSRRGRSTGLGHTSMLSQTAISVHAHHDHH